MIKLPATRRPKTKPLVCNKKHKGPLPRLTGKDQKDTAGKSFKGHALPVDDRN